jgi:hypothetical protein
VDLKRIYHGNLIGLGFGAKETEGALTGDLAVRIYVKRKLPKSELPHGICVPTAVNGITTDVVAVGALRFHARPVAFGAGISHAQGKPGSLGCVVTTTDGTWYALSACHVLAPAGIAEIGDEIVEPAAPQAGAARIATLADFEALKPDDEVSINRFDAAIARLDRKADVLNRIPAIGSVRTATMDPVLYESVRKFGAGTLHTLGIVTDVFADVSFAMGGENYRFDDVLEVTGCGSRFSEGGDSGALVVDALTNSPIGLVIGGARDRTYVSPIARVLNRFGAHLIA